ncbi:MAG: hypothetical protein GW913_12800, partial [Myxococcales bacterium]|nr:hypothetical protein [Myxococcales bacterium]
MDAEHSRGPSNVVDSASSSGDAELEWARVVEAVAQRAVGPLRDRPEVPIHASRELAKAALEGTAEALRLARMG